MPTIVKTPSGTWKAVIRKTGFPSNIKTFRLKKDAEDWARRTEDEMVRGLFIQRGPSERLTFEKAMERYLAEVTPTKRPFFITARRLARSNTSLMSWLIRIMPMPWRDSSEMSAPTLRVSSGPSAAVGSR